jgi:hypothetical protein
MLADLAGLDTLMLLAAEGRPPPEGVLPEVVVIQRS